jgi:MFS family permease
MLIGAVSALFLMSKGLQLKEIVYLKGLQALVILIADIPFGYFADRFSRKYSVIFSIFCGSIWLGTTAYAPSVRWLYIAEIFNALSLAFFSGAFESILIETYKTHAKADVSLKVIMAKFTKYDFLGMAIAVLVGGLCVQTNSTFFWWVASGILFFQALFLSPLISDVSVQSRTFVRGKLTLHDLWIDIEEISSYFKQQKGKLISYFSLSILLGVFYQIIIQYWQPMVQSFIQIFSDTHYSIFYSITFILILLSQSYAGKIFETSKFVSLTEKNALILAIFASIGLLLGVKWSPILIVPSLVLMFFSIRYFNIILSAYINEQISDRLRATYLSFNSTILRGILILIAPIMAIGIEKMGFLPILISGVFIFTLAFAINEKGRVQSGKSTQ